LPEQLLPCIDVLLQEQHILPEFLQQQQLARANHHMTLVKKANVGVDQLVDGTDLQFGNTMKCCVGAIPTHQLGDKLYLKWVECLECHQVHQANKWRKATMCLRALKE
jgi:hypothetical protein